MAKGRIKKSSGRRWVRRIKSRRAKSARVKPRRTKSEKTSRRLLRTTAKIMIGLMAFSLVQVASLRFINPPITMAVLWDYTWNLISGTPYQRPKMAWRTLSAISPHLQRAVLAAEDQRFPLHHGFDLVEIRVTVKEMVTDGRVRGASTISMQTARTVFLLPARNIVRKGLEAYYTVLLELIWNKGRIMEMYLNTVDWGTGIMGAEAAAQTYFKRSAKRLTPRQAALLAAILPNPHRFSPTRPTTYLNQRARRILADMPKMSAF